MRSNSKAWWSQSIRVRPRAHADLGLAGIVHALRCAAVDAHAQVSAHAAEQVNCLACEKEPLSSANRLTYAVQ
eukprot:3989577-Pleurochrysis_carterae.AAC.1